MKSKLINLINSVRTLMRSTCSINSSPTSAVDKLVAICADDETNSTAHLHQRLDYCLGGCFWVSEEGLECHEDIGMITKMTTTRRPRSSSGRLGLGGARSGDDEQIIGVTRNGVEEFLPLFGAMERGRTPCVKANATRTTVRGAQHTCSPPVSRDWAQTEETCYVKVIWCRVPWERSRL